MHPEFVEKLKNIESLYGGKSWREISRIKHDMISEFLNCKDELVEPVSQIVLDPSSSFFTLDLALSMAEIADDERIVPCLIQLLEENKDGDEDICERVSNILWSYGAPAAKHIVKKLKENFEKKLYNHWLVDALNGGECVEFVRETIEDFLGNRGRYEDWFDLGHFAWKLAEFEKAGVSPLPLLEELSGQKNLHREDRLEMKRLLSFLKNEEKFQDEESEEERRREELISKLILTGLLHVKIGELVPDGPRPIIDDGNLEEYSPLLYQMERLIFDYSVKHPSLKDSDVVELLKNVRDGIWKGYEGRDDFEMFFIAGLKLSVFILADLRYTKGEISACISHVLNSVKRHRELGGNRNYLDSVRDFFMGEIRPRK